MQRINTTNKALDLFGAGKDGYRAGNPAIGQSATELSFSAMNALQEEIANAIEGSGAVLNPGSNAQLLGAIRALAQTQGDARYAALTAFAQSLTASGYQKLPGGLIIQWGAVSFSGVTSVPVVFPIAFTASVLQIVCSQSDAASVIMGRKLATTLTGFTALASVSEFNCSWIAIGQ